MGQRLWVLVMAGLLGVAAPWSAVAVDKTAVAAMLPKDLKLPTSVTVGFYLPAGVRKGRFYWQQSSTWMQPGSAVEAGVKAVGQQFFANSFVVEPDDARPFGLLIDLHPVPTFANGDVTMTLNYKVFGAASAVLLEGKQSATASIGDVRTSSGMHTAAAQAAQLLVIDLINKLRPDATNYPPTTVLKDIRLEQLVDHDKPVSTGTGFFINASGQILTAAHVVEDCAVLEARQEGDALSGQVVASSHLVDLAVLDTGRPAGRFLPLRTGNELVLGEPVINIGYPLQPILASSPNLTRGNVSSKGALEGSLGQFQFTAPIQPGSSGGPVVADHGELLGVTQSTLNVSRLVSQGVVPQNVNFALAAKYVAMFLRKHSIAYTEVTPTGPVDGQKGAELALAATLRLSCFQ